MRADRFCQSFPWSFWTLASFPRTGCCWPDFVGASEVLLEKHWSFGIRLCCPVIPMWDGKLSWEAIGAIGHYSTYGNGLVTWGYASTSHWEPRQKNCLPDFAGFRLTLALGNLVVAGVGAMQGTHLENVIFFPKVWWWFWVCFKGFCKNFLSGNLAGIFSTNHGVVQNNSSKQVGFWHTSSLDSSPKLPRPLVNALLAVNPEAGAYWNISWLGIYPKDEGGIFDPAIRRSWEFCIFAAETRNLHRSSSPTSGTRDGQWLGHSSRTNPQRPGLVEVLVA